MPAARYWRAVGLAAYGGGDVELSAFRLYEGEADPHWSNVSLLLHMEGTAGSSTFTDSSSTPKTVSAFGSPAPVLSATRAKFGSTSLLMNTSGGGIYAGVEALSSPDFDFGTSDFSIEWFQYWASKTVPPYQAAFQRGYNVAGAMTLVTGNGDGRYSLYVGSGTAVLTESTSGAAGEWTHYALTRSGTTFTLWRNGTQSATGSYAGQIGGNAKRFAIGCYGSDSGAIGQVFNGYIDEFRITKGIARYTADFTPPTAPFPSALQTLIRVDQGATLSSTLPAVSGDIPSLQDDNTATVVRLSAREPGFALQWDFGAEATKTVVAAAPGSGADQMLFLSHFDLQSSSDGKFWVQEATPGSYPWPGPNTVAPATNFQQKMVETKNAMPAAAVISGPPQSYTANTAATAETASDVEFGGSYSIYGTVELYNQGGNLPLPRRVRLHRSRDGLLVRETWSDAQGNYRFDGITDRYKYDVIAWDHEGLQQSVVANDLTPEVMP